MKCYKASEAKDIAEGDQGTDDNPPTSPGPGWNSKWWDPTRALLPAGIIDTSDDNYKQWEVNAYYHALHPGSSPGKGNPALWYEATTGKGSLEKLGQYLHYLQDTYSHEGFHSPKEGHGRSGHLPDHTIEDPHKVVRAAGATWQALNEYAKLKKCCSDKWKPEWNSIVLKFAQIGLPTRVMRFAFEGSLSDLELKRDVLNVPPRRSNGDLK